MDLPRLKIGSDIETQMGVYIKDRHVPTIVMGKSSTGKSTSLTNWWQTDHYYRNSKILVDPSGFLARDAYSISGGKYCSLENPISLNPMKGNFSKEQKSDLVAECINQVIKLTVEDSIRVMTPKMRDIFDLSFKACIDKNRLSLLHVLDYIKNLSGDRETRDGLIARLQFLLNDENMKKILCGNNAVEWGDLINKQQTFILDCFGMSKEKFIFTGSLVSNGIKNYFRLTKQKEYKPVSIYIDECHNFINPSMLDIFKEGRKYAVSIICATQDFAVIDERMTRVMLNSGNIISYKLGYREASLIAKEMNISPQDIQFIEKYHVAYLTPKEKGFAKAPRPVFIKEVETPVAEVEPQREVKPSWFTLESYQPSQTTK